MAVGPFAAWLDAKQARHNDAVPEALRTEPAMRLVRRGDRALALTTVAGLGICILLGIGSRTPVGYAGLGLAVLAGLAGSGWAVVRLGRLEDTTQPHEERDGHG
jgi:hypothetical protein